MTQALVQVENPPMVVHLSPIIHLTDDQFYELCRINRELRIERTAERDLICLDFIIELRSPTDSLAVLQVKMQEYMDNGAQLGWLIDPEPRRVYLYRPNSPVECREDLAEISGDPVLPGWTLNLQEIWEAGF